MPDSKLFINRKQEVAFLKKDIAIERSKSRLLFISAKTGIGKSALVDQVLKEYATADYRINIAIDKAKEIHDGYFIKQVARLFHSNALSDSRYRDIFQFLNADRFYKNVANGLVKVIKKYIGIDDFYEGFNSASHKKVDALQSWMGDDNELIEICYKYVSSFAVDQKLYLVIENFQLIDQKSLLLIRDLLASSSYIYMVAEYSISDQDRGITDDVEMFGNEDIELHHLRLEKIDKQELINSIKDEKELLIGIIERTYENSDGNLHKFKLLRNTNHLRNYDINIASYNNVTKHLLNSLDDLSLSIIVIIQTHQGSVGKILLSFFLKNAASFQFRTEDEYNSKMLSLKEIGLIDILPNQITLKHDSISFDIQEIGRTQRLQVVIVRDWIRVYQLVERNASVYDIEYIDNLLGQIYFMLKLDSFQEIGGVLQKLSKFISTSPTHNIVFQLDKITSAYRKHIANERNINIFKWLVVMYYQCGYGDKVVDLAEPILLTDPTILLCYLASLSTIDHAQVFEFLRDLDYQNDAQLELGAVLVRIRTLRSADRLEECLELWNEHFEKKTFKNSFFEAGFLKYSSLVIHDDYEFRMDCLNRASVLFQQNRDKYGQVSTAVTLSRDSAYIGDIANCRYYLQQAENLANKVVYPRYQLYNNRAVLDIISDTISQITKDGLDNALRICANSGDRLIIQSNILVIAIMETDTISGYQVYERLRKHILDQFDEEDTILQICLYNCYRYALTLSETEEAAYLRGYLEKTVIKQDHELWHYLLYDREENKYPYVIKKEYYPTFMIGWDLDYYNVLNNYQQAIAETE